MQPPPAGGPAQAYWSRPDLVTGRDRVQVAPENEVTAASCSRLYAPCPALQRVSLIEEFPLERGLRRHAGVVPEHVDEHVGGSWCRDGEWLVNWQRVAG